MSNTDKGFLGGAALGTGVGAVIGKATGNTAAGAVLGGVVGATAGALTGAAVDEHKQEQAVRQAQAQRGPLGLQEIADLSRNRVADQVIVQQIQLSGVVYNLSADQIVWLKQAGVSDYVIASMQQTGYGRRVYVPPAAGVVVVEEAPPPPRIGVGFTYVGGRRW